MYCSLWYCKKKKYGSSKICSMGLLFVILFHINVLYTIFFHGILMYSSNEFVYLFDYSKSKFWIFAIQSDGWAEKITENPINKFNTTH